MQYFDIRGRRHPQDWRIAVYYLARPPSPPLLCLVVISYRTFFYSQQRHCGRSTCLLLITAASHNQTSTTCFARDSGHWTAFEIWPARHEPSNIGHKNSITSCTFSKPVTGLKPVYRLTGLPLNKPSPKCLYTHHGNWTFCPLAVLPQDVSSPAWTFCLDVSPLNDSPSGRFAPYIWTFCPWTFRPIHVGVSSPDVSPPELSFVGVSPSRCGCTDGRFTALRPEACSVKL